jgi:preprotein translocase subunit SecY
MRNIIPGICRKAGYAAAGLAHCEIGLRTALPGIDGVALHHSLGPHGTGLLRAYDFLAAGGISRRAVPALGVLPYLSARLFMLLGERLAAPADPEVVRDADREAPPPSLTRGAMAARAASPRDPRSTLDVRSSGT